MYMTYNAVVCTQYVDTVYLWNPSILQTTSNRFLGDWPTAWCSQKQWQWDKTSNSSSSSSISSRSIAKMDIYWTHSTMLLCQPNPTICKFSRPDPNR